MWYDLPPPDQLRQKLSRMPARRSELTKKWAAVRDFRMIIG